MAWSTGRDRSNWYQPPVQLVVFTKMLRIYVRIVRTKVRTPVPCPGDSGLNPGESGFNHVLVLFKLFLVFGAKVKHLSFV